MSSRKAFQGSLNWFFPTVIQSLAWFLCLKIDSQSISKLTFIMRLPADVVVIMLVKHAVLWKLVSMSIWKRGDDCKVFLTNESNHYRRKVKESIFIKQYDSGKLINDKLASVPLFLCSLPSYQQQLRGLFILVWI
jgi:hypothetical protein